MEGDDRVDADDRDIAPLATNYSLIVRQLLIDIVIREPPVCLVFTISEPHSTIVLLFCKAGASVCCSYTSIEKTHHARQESRLRRAGRIVSLHVLTLYCRSAQSRAPASGGVMEPICRWCQPYASVTRSARSFAPAPVPDRTDPALHPGDAQNDYRRAARCRFDDLCASSRRAPSDIANTRRVVDVIGQAGDHFGRVFILFKRFAATIDRQPPWRESPPVRAGKDTLFRRGARRNGIRCAGATEGVSSDGPNIHCHRQTAKAAPENVRRRVTSPYLFFIVLFSHRCAACWWYQAHSSGIFQQVRSSRLSRLEWETTSCAVERADPAVSVKRSALCPARAVTLIARCRYRECGIGPNRFNENKFTMSPFCIHAVCL